MASVAKFAIALEDMLSSPAKKAQASVDKLSSSLKTAKTQLSGYQSQLSIAKSLGDVEGYRKYSSLVDQSKKSVFGLAQQLEGAQSGLGAGASGMGELAASLGPVGIAAGVAAAAIGGLVVVTGSLVGKALEVVNANQQLAATFEALGGKGAGKATLGMLNELSEKLPQSKNELAEWTKRIQATGVTDLSKIRSELIATASAQAIMGDEGAAAYQKIQERVRLAVEAHHGLKLAEKSLKALYLAGVNVTDISKRMGMTTQELSAKLKAGTIDAQKFGDALNASVTEKGKGPLDVMMNSLETLGKKASAAFSRLFSDVDTKPLTDALRNVIALGDAGAPSGEALKMGITTGLNAVIRLLGHAITEAEVFFLEIEVKALQTYIALKPLIGAVEKISSAMGKVGGALGLGAPPPGAGGGAPPTEGVSTGRVAAESVLTGFAGPLAMVPGIFLDVVSAIGNAQALEIARAGGVKVGEATIEGIREGVDAHSPSVAAMKIGMDLGAGLGMGMADSPEPERAARTISGNALGGLAARGGALFGGAPANDTGGTTIGPIEIHIVAPNGVTDAHALSVIGLSAALERFQIGSGR